MAILIHCACGKAVRVKNELAGKWVKCPQCGEAANVPTPSLDPPDQREKAPARRRKTKQAELPENDVAAVGRPWWPWAIGASGLALATVLVLVLLLNEQDSTSGDKDPSAPVAKARDKTASPVKQSLRAPEAQADPALNPVPKPKPKSRPAPRPKALVLKPLTAAENQIRTAFGVRLVQAGQATAGSWNEFAGRPLAGIVAEVEAMAATSVTFTASSATAFAEGQEFPAVVLFLAGGQEGLASARLLKGAELRSGPIEVGADKFPFALPALGAQKEWMLLPALLEGKPGMDYGFRPDRKVRLGFLFAAKVDDLTHVRILGHTFARDGTRLDKAPQPAEAKKDQPTQPEMKPEVKVDQPADQPKPKVDQPIEKVVARLEVYHYQPRVQIRGSTSKNVQITENPDGTHTVKGLGKDSQMAAYRGPNGQLRVVPDTLGSTNLHILVKRKPGYTTAAGLRFRQNTILNIWEDGVVQVKREGVPATTEDGTRYVSRLVTVKNRRAIVMVKVPDRSAVKPEEKNPQEKNELLASSKLKLALSLLNAGKAEKTRSYCEEIIARYPRTQAAVEAKALLNKLAKK